MLFLLWALASRTKSVPWLPLHFSVFKYVTISQSCWSGSCDHEGMPLRILPFRNAQNKTPGGAPWIVAE